MVNQKGNLTSHTKLCEKLLNGVLSAENRINKLQHSTEIPCLERRSLSLANTWRLNQTRILHFAIQTAPSKRQGSAGVYIPNRNGSGSPIEMSYHIGENSTVFQAKTLAVEQAAKLLIENCTKNKTIIFNCDSQATIKALNSTKIKSKTTLNAQIELHKLGRDNHVSLRWIPAHKGYSGNEKADELAKKGSEDNIAQT